MTKSKTSVSKIFVWILLGFLFVGLIGFGTGNINSNIKTIEAVRSLMPKAHVATVYAKPMGRGQVETFITEVSQDTWIFFPWDMALQYVEPYRGNE